MPFNLQNLQFQVQSNTAPAIRNMQQFITIIQQTDRAFLVSMNSMSNSMKSISAVMDIYLIKKVVEFSEKVVGVGAKFEEEMSNVKAVSAETAENMDILTESARQMAIVTKYSATDCAEALSYMALAGYDENKSIAMLPDVLDLAAAGTMNLAKASDMITDSQTALGLSMQETTVLVDQMAQTANKTNTDVAQLGEAILTIGGTAQNLKGGITELNTLLGILANNSIKGEEGGTKLRNMMNSLVSPTKEAAETLDELGVSIKDSQGIMRAFFDVMQDMKKGLSSFAQVDQLEKISTIFNIRDMAAAQAILNTTTNTYNELFESIENAKGAAKEMADTKMDNLNGEIEKLKSNLEET